jgi:hypothetical protein
VDQLPKHFDVDVVEAPDVQAALTGFKRAEPVKQPRVSIFEAADKIDHQMLFTWREARDRRIALWLNSPEFWDGLPPSPP